MAHLKFRKVSGAGNNFVVFAADSSLDLENGVWPDMARRLCARRPASARTGWSSADWSARTRRPRRRLLQRGRLDRNDVRQRAAVLRLGRAPRPRLPADDSPDGRSRARGGVSGRLRCG